MASDLFIDLFLWRLCSAFLDPFLETDLFLRKIALPILPLRNTHLPVAGFIILFRGQGILRGRTYFILGGFFLNRLAGKLEKD